VTEIAPIAAIYRDGAHYDRMWGRGYVDFWLSQARAGDGPVLELGCGTGKLAIPLAEAGFSVTGLDNSPALLAFAAGRSDKVRWVEGDMRRFALDERYALKDRAEYASPHGPATSHLHRS
jgi:SAM-dependent methyltransferase